MNYKNILVIGGSGLIGSSVVNFLEKNDFTVFVIDKKRKVSTKNFLKYNINEKTDYEKLLNVSIKKFKNIDAIINCIYPAKKVKSKNYYKDIIKHVEPYIKLTNIFGNYFAKKKFGQIINFASIYGNILPRFEIYKNTNISSTPIDYALSKNLIIKISKFYAKYFLKKKIFINSLSLGGISENQDINFIKNYSKYVISNNLLNKNDINDFILYLLTSKSMKFTGQDFCFDDGFSL